MILFLFYCVQSIVRLVQNRTKIILLELKIAVKREGGSNHQWHRFVWHKWKQLLAKFPFYVIYATNGGHQITFLRDFKFNIIVSLVHKYLSTFMAL